MKIQPIVEGHGEVSALPVLLRRLRDRAQAFEWEILSPIRRKRSDFRTEEGVSKAVRIATKNPSCNGILVLFDSDGDAPCEWGPRVAEWARAAAGALPCGVVLAHKEYEAWFLASIESLRGNGLIRDDARSHPEPERLGGAKAHLEERMVEDRRYAETVDQAALSASFDLGAAYRACRSFKKLVKAFGEIVATQSVLENWPPAEWLQA